MVSSQRDDPMARYEAPVVASALVQIPSHRTHRWGIGAFLLVEAVLLISAAFVSVILDPAPNGRNIPVSHVFIGTMAPMVIAAALTILITRIRGNGPKLDLRLGWSWVDAKVGLKFGLLGLVSTSIAAFIWTKVVGEENGTSAVSALVENQPMSVAAAIAMFIYLWLLGPICEEIIYRGLLWGGIEKLKWANEKHGRIAAFILSTVVFALSHFEPLRTTLLLVIAIPIGLARLVTGRLISSIFAHSMNNFVPALAVLLTAFGVLKA